MPDITKFPRGVPGRDLRLNIAPHVVWAAPDYIATHERWRYEPGKIFLGSLGQQIIGVDDDRHLMTIAGSRAGKGVSTIIPNLIEYTLRQRGPGWQPGDTSERLPQSFL